MKGFEVVETVKNLGVIIDSDLSFNSHMKAITKKSSFYHLKKQLQRLKTLYYRLT